MKSKGLRCGIAALAGAVCLTAGGIAAAAEKNDLPMLSYGVQVLAAKTDMAISAPIGNEAVFSAEAFARALNLSKVEYITVLSVPDAALGELLLGSTRVAAGQTVTSENLSYMSFCAATDDVKHASFRFTANGESAPMVCNVYLMEKINYTPTVSMASGLSLNLSTYKDISVYGRLSAYDPDGDDLIFEVVSYPQNGCLRMTEQRLGTYVYTPNAGYVGRDSFTYVARDKYGNYSAAATVHLKVELSGTSVTYADMEKSDAYCAALSLTEAGVMSGTQMGNRYYFDPNGEVSRAEFLVMAMNVAGITDVPDVEATVFADNGDIPESLRGYVAAAYEMQYISGSLSEGQLCFLPNESITRAQAAVILSNIIGLCDVSVTPTFADGSDIPVWAREAIYSLNSAGILDSLDGYIAPSSRLTRAQTARILAAAMEYREMS